MAEIVIRIRDIDGDTLSFEMEADPHIDLRDIDAITDAQALGVELLSHAQNICGISDQEIIEGGDKTAWN